MRCLSDVQSPSDLIPCEVDYRIAKIKGWWEPEPKAPWGKGLAKPGRAYTGAHERNVERILKSLRKKPRMGYVEVAKAAGMCASTASKTLTFMVRDGQVDFERITTKQKGSNKTYKRRVYTVRGLG
jgi:hypothetical protein